MSNDEPDTPLEHGRLVQMYEDYFPVASTKWLRRMRNEPGFGTEPRRRAHTEAVLSFYYTDEPAQQRPSDFMQRLIALMDKSDNENLARCALGFPDEALAVYICKYIEGGCEFIAQALREAAKLDTEAARRALGTPLERRDAYMARCAAARAPLPGRGPGPAEQNARAAYRNLEDTVRGQEPAEEPCDRDDPHDCHMWTAAGNIDYMCPGQ